VCARWQHIPSVFSSVRVVNPGRQGEGHRAAAMVWPGGLRRRDSHDTNLGAAGSDHVDDARMPSYQRDPSLVRPSSNSLPMSR